MKDATQKVLDEYNEIPGLSAKRNPCSGNFERQRKYPKTVIINWLRQHQRLINSGVSRSTNPKKEIRDLGERARALEANRNTKWIDSFRPIPLKEVEFVSSRSAPGELETPMVKAKVAEIAFDDDDLFLWVEAQPKASYQPRLFFVYTTISYLREVSVKGGDVSFLMYLRPLVEQNSAAGYYQGGDVCFKDTQHDHFYPYGFDYIHKSRFDLIFTQARFEYPSKERSGMGIAYQFKGSNKRGILISPIPFHNDAQYVKTFGDRSYFPRVLNQMLRLLQSKQGIKAETRPKPKLAVAAYSSGNQLALKLLLSTKLYRHHPFQELYILDPVGSGVASGRSPFMVNESLEWWKQDRSNRSVRVYTQNMTMLTNVGDPKFKASPYKSGYIYKFDPRFSVAWLPRSFWSNFIVKRTIYKEIDVHYKMIPHVGVFDALRRSKMFRE